MSLLKLIYFYGIVITIFNLIWFFIAWLIKSLISDNKNFNVVNIGLHIIGISILSSLIALQTTKYVELANLTSLGIVLIGTIGGLIVYSYTMEKTIQSNRNVRFFINNIPSSKQQLIPKWTVLISIIVYVLSFNFQEIRVNKLNLWFYNNIYDIYDTFLLKIIFGFIGIFFVINMINKAILATTNLFIKKIIPKTKQNNQFDDYEVVDEDDDTNQNKLQ